MPLPPLETTRYEVEDGIATITLHRPDKLNAYNGQMRVELGLLFDETDADDEVKAVIVTGAGRAFCAGADLSSGGDTFDRKAPQNQPYLEKLRVGDVYRDGGGTNTLRIYESLKPVIGAINGPAVGIGATIQLPMDMRLASTAARFGFVFARRGITPRGRVVVVPAAPGRHADGARVVHDRPRVRCRRGARARAGALGARARRAAAGSARARAGDRRQHGAGVGGADAADAVAAVGGRASDACASDRQPGDPGARMSADVREGVGAFLEKRRAVFPDRVSSGMPGFFPWWQGPGFE